EGQGQESNDQDERRPECGFVGEGRETSRERCVHRAPLSGGRGWSGGGLRRRAGEGGAGLWGRRSRRRLGGELLARLGRQALIFLPFLPHVLLLLRRQLLQRLVLLAGDGALLGR